MVEKEELINKFREMSSREKEYSEKLAGLAEKFRHPLLQSLILAISRDSMKHSIFYKALADLLSMAQPVLTEEEYKAIAEGIDEHIRMEEDMIKFTKELADQVDDPRLKLVLLAIHEDEVKHHKLLLSIKKNIAEKEKFGEEELWDAVWKDSPWHGTPGG